MKNIFQHKTTMGRHAPHRDWLIIIAIFSVMFVLILLSGIYLFYGISNGTLFIPSASTSTTTSSSIDRASLVNTMSYYTDKASKLENLKSSPLSLIDPGL